MNITFKKGRENKCYEEFVNNPLDGSALRQFCKLYPKTIVKEVLNRHRLLSLFQTAAQYNAVYGATDNRIEKLQGIKGKEYFILKVRITSSYRKFFYVVSDIKNNEYLKVENWAGQFKDVSDIFVIEVNKHDYSKF